MAAACLAIYLISAAAADVSMLALTSAVRGVVFLAAGLAAGQAREISLRGQEVASELEAMRQALTPDKLPEIPGLDSGTDDPAEILKLANRAVHARTQGTGEFVTVVSWPTTPASRWCDGPAPVTPFRSCSLVGGNWNRLATQCRWAWTGN